MSTNEMTPNNQTPEMTEALERPDTIWMSLDMGKAQPEETMILDFSDAVKSQGDFGFMKSLIVTGIPLYGTSDDVLDSAMRYIFNQIEIFEKTKENKTLGASVGSGV